MSPAESLAQRGRFGILPMRGARTQPLLQRPLFSGPAQPLGSRLGIGTGQGFGSRIFGQPTVTAGQPQPVVGRNPTFVPLLAPANNASQPAPNRQSTSTTQALTNRYSNPNRNARSTSSGINAPGEIKMSYPETATEALAYKLNGTEFTLRPGKTVNLAPSAQWELEFNAGGQFGLREATLEGGKNYVFEKTEDEGWVLMMDAPPASLADAMDTETESPRTLTREQTSPELEVPANLPTSATRAANPSTPTEAPSTGEPLLLIAPTPADANNKVTPIESTKSKAEPTPATTGGDNTGGDNAPQPKTEPVKLTAPANPSELPAPKSSDRDGN
ncbi:MAG: hypothetical protein AAFN77_02375 [Planctomycetota bacterium]